LKQLGDKTEAWIQTCVW